MARKIYHVVTPAALMLLAACGGGGGSDIECVVLPPGVEATVVSAASGAPMSCGARVVVTDGSYSDEGENLASSDCDDSLPLEAAHGRGGSYTVTVFKDGYRDFTVSDVDVDHSGCSTRTARITATMVAD